MNDSLYTASLDRVCSSPSYFSSPLIAGFFVLYSSFSFAANPPVSPTNPLAYTSVTTPYTSTTGPAPPRQISHIPPRGNPNVGGGSSYPIPPKSPLTPTVSGGGFNAPGRVGITIEAIKTAPKTSVPATTTMRYPPPSVAGAAKTLLKGGLAQMALAGGLQALLDGVDWLINEGSLARKNGDSQLAPPDVLEDSDLVTQPASFSPRPATPPMQSIAFSGAFQICSNTRMVTGVSHLFHGFVVLNRKMYCTYLPDSSPLPPYSPTLEPVPYPDIDAAVDSKYSPTPEDFDWLAPHMFPQSSTVDPIPRQSMPPVTTTTIDLDTGVTTTVETNIWHDFAIDNSKPVPEIEVSTTTQEDKFVDGQPAGSSSTTTNQKPDTNAKPDPDAPAGGGGAPPAPIPTDCDFMPTVCAFIDWYKGDDLGDDPDLSSLIKDDSDFERENVVSFGGAGCPAPYQVTISLINRTVEVSYQPFCDFALLIRSLFIALCTVIAAVLVYRSI